MHLKEFLSRGNWGHRHEALMPLPESTNNLANICKLAFSVNLLSLLCLVGRGTRVRKLKRGFFSQIVSTHFVGGPGIILANLLEILISHLKLLIWQRKARLLSRKTRNFEISRVGSRCLFVKNLLALPMFFYLKPSSNHLKPSQDLLFCY